MDHIARPHHPAGTSLWFFRAATVCSRHWTALLHAFCEQRYVPLFRLTLVYLAVCLVLRLVLLLVFGPPAQVSPVLSPAILLLGTVNDLLEALYLTLPLTLYLFLVPQRIYSSRPGRLFLGVMLWAAIFGLFYLAAVQFFFFLEFDARFNLVAVDYLIYPHEILVNIWEAYPVARVLFFTAALSGLLMIFLWPVIGKSMDHPSSLRSRLALFCCQLLLLAGAIAVFSTQSLGVFSNRVANELTANGLSSFFQAFHTNQLDYERYYHTGDPAQLFSLLGRELAAQGGKPVASSAGDLRRSFAADSHGLGRLNVVVIVEESLGCEHVDVCGQGLDIDQALGRTGMRLTPQFDQLARQGMFFTRAYATGTRTVRGLEAVSASFPPIPSESIIKRPGGEHVATWGRVMRDNGYQTSFLYGGYGRFDNMTPYFRGNGFTVADRLEIRDPAFANIWGVSDQDLFRFALDRFDRFDREKQPFFSIIMTTSNHSPFTFPRGIPGIPAKGGGRNAGVLYADHSLGEFFASARSHSWFDKTLFVVVADHGARVYGAARIPLASYEIPLLLYAPGHIAPQQVNTPISQMDLAPTVLGLLGLPYTAPFFGRNVLAESPVPPTLLFNHNHDVALYRQGKLVVLGLRDRVTTYDYVPGQKELKKTGNIPRLTNLATAYYQCAYELFRDHTYL